MKKRSTTAVVVLLTLIMTFMEMSALPAALFCNVKIEDINPIYITLMLNINATQSLHLETPDWWYVFAEYSIISATQR